ncbi:MAG: CheR family methyltransferase [Ralstonia sp.]|uniref:Methyltransferase domain-containing protein n=1 Tax=Ralstonia pickettii TaxID=329 RepID=A0A9Q2H1N8_RALPI|nr:CheR family methyltransferase [Ralstonia pickettii]MBA9844055.1 methyltransferase domain-containing protein [Ralstonia pickettii]MBA9849741.1 methyltransferase domain-containing protein [Ralstonia pickettii]MBA9876848.1 methyltransferase domain-containing protein [Ralstonia pickettii]MBA9880692.1 methyltransferase domain-containing protein [Ralstonia pickettii]MBA9886656.1 methyltransferase domain-containing protein [Ralstonia pickettii]
MVAVDPRFEAWLSHETGIDAPSLGTNTLERAVLDRTRAMLAARGMRDTVDAAALDAYWLRLNTAPDERQALIEALVVPETWFFRDREAFVTLARVVGEKLAREPMRVLRILSAPCSTGEEPYSAAMALLDAGIDPARFTIDAIDISARAIEQARRAIYGRNAFRGHPLTFRDRHFTGADGSWQLSDTVRGLVRFAQGNLSDAPADDTRYDFIFCRNVLIYFHRDAQDQAIRRLDSQLAEDGMIFVGPAETGLMMRHAMTSARIPLAFAFQRTAASETGVRAPLPFRLPLPPEHPASVVGLPGVALPSVPVRAVAARVPAASRPSPTSSFAAGPVARPLLPTIPEIEAVLGEPPTVAQARRLADAGNLDEAERVALEIANLRAPEADTFYLLGLIADARGRHADAGDFYRKALYLEPAHYEALTHLAALLDVAGDTVAARQLMLRAERALARQAKTPSASSESETPEHTRGTHGARRP